MNPKTIYTKTGKGMLEMKNKSLPKDISRVLTLIDGKSNVGSILGKEDKSDEAKLREMLKKLENEGYIRVFSTGPETMFSGDLDFTKGVVVSEIKADVYNEAKARQQAQSQPPSRPGATQPPPRPAATQWPPRQPLNQPSIHDIALIEAEARAKKAAEEKPRKEAEAKARAETEARARAEAEAKAKREAEAKARAETEARARAEAEARARAEAKVREEAAAKARREAEAKAKAEAEARAKLEAEAKARAEAAARAKLEAEARARAEVAARAKVEAEAKAKKEEAELRVRHEEEARARIEAEAKAKQKEAELRVRYEEEAKARIEAEAKAKKEEAELRVRYEQEARARIEGEAKTRIEAESRAKGEIKVRKETEARSTIEAEARLQAEIEAQLKAGEESKIKAETEEKLRKEARDKAKAEEEVWAKAEAEIRESIKESARKEEKQKPAWMIVDEKEEEQRKTTEREEFEAKERAKAEEKSRAEAEATRAAEAKAKAEEETKAQKEEKKQAKASRKPRNWKPAAIGFAVLFAAAVSLIPFIPFNVYIPAIEKLAAETLHEPVTINSLHISLLPSPQVNLEGFIIGKLKDIKFETVRVSGLDLVLGGSTRLGDVEVDSATLEQGALARIASWGKSAGGAPALQISRVNFRNVRLALKNIPLAPLHGEISLAKDGTFQKASLRTSDSKISAQVIGKGEQFEVTLSAKGWQLPIGPELAFDYLDANAVATRDGMQFNNIDAKLYGGTAKGTAVIKWDNGWGLSGDFDAKNMELTPVIVIFARNFLARGTLDSKGRYTMQAQTPDKLFDAPRVESSFTVNRGSLNNMDLTRALQAPSREGVRGGKTLFDEFSGNLSFSDGRYQLREMRLVSGPLSATGSADISSGNQLAGRVNVELKSGTTFIKNSFTVSGNLNDLVLRSN
ncbi:MAG TPA: hypothetical protein VIW72_06600 [Burkholderiales bacterium]